MAWFVPLLSARIRARAELPDAGKRLAPILSGALVPGYGDTVPLKARRGVGEGTVSPPELGAAGQADHHMGW